MSRNTSRRRGLLSAGTAVASGIAGCSSDPAADAGPPPSSTVQSASATPADDGGRRILVYAGRPDPVAEIPPASSETPVQDAIDVCVEEGGSIILPPGSIQERGPINLQSGVDVRGYGVGRFGPRTRIEITDTGVDGMNDVETEHRFGLRGVTLDGFELLGPGSDGPTGPGFHVTKGLLNCTFGSVGIRNFADSSIRLAADSYVFQVTWNYLAAHGNDPGSADAEADVDFARVGNGFEVDHVAVYPSNDASGGTFDAFRLGNVDRGSFNCRIGSVNVGGDPSRFGSIQNAGCRIGFVNFEPSSPPQTTPNEILELGGPPAGPTYVDHLKIGGEAEAGYGVSLQHGPGNYVLGPVMNYVLDDAANLVEIADEPVGYCWYYGSREDLDNTAGSSTALVRALGSAGAGVG